MISTIQKIPQPKAFPIIGNLKDLNIEAPTGSLGELAKQYGEIYKLQLPGEELIVVSSQELVNELCDTKRFYKKVLRPLVKLRDVAGDGLFTADTHNPNWEKAHRILMPAFGPGAIRSMFPQMLDISEQLMLKLERQGKDQPINVSDAMTRLTLDTIALAAFGYRLNSFYQEKMHPFVEAMMFGLAEGGKRANRFPIQDTLMFLANRKFKANTDYLNKVADQIIIERKNNPRTGKKDLLDLMLNAQDPITGEKLSEENIRYQLITFLVAGHETTSGMLSYTIHLLLKNPEVLKKAQEEVDRVLGNEIPTTQHIQKLNYIDQILKESLRLHPTAPAFAVQSNVDTIIGGKYEIKKGQPIIVLMGQLHREAKIWGDNAEAFQPERFDQDAFEKMPMNCYKPFGNGARACIGRAFAIQEAILAIAMLLQRFDISACNDNYELIIKETLTTKPEGLFITAKKRDGFEFIEKSQSNIIEEKSFGIPQKESAKNQIPLLVLYGSNSGSSENFAQKIASEASANGFKSNLAILNDYTNQLPKEGAVIIVTASYEGKPTHNAQQFVNWLENIQANEIEGIPFTIFGCGNRDWVRTYQAIPKQIEKQLLQGGAISIMERGEADARGDFFGDFETWYEGFWKKMGTHFAQNIFVEKETQAVYEVEIMNDSRTGILQQKELQTGTVIENRELVNMNHPLGKSKRHIEIQLPEGMHYQAGDYLAILPSNPKKNIDRALSRFHVEYDTPITIHKQLNSVSYLPTGFPIVIGEIFKNYVELAQPATKKQVSVLAKACVCPPHKIQLMTFTKDKKHQTEILEKRVSVLDLLERFAAIDIELSTFLEMLQPLKPRQYSISSSPLRMEDHLTLTVAVVDAPAWSGQGKFQGVASNFLAYAQPGTKVNIVTRPSNINFCLPEKKSTPIIMIGAGTGIAPFRGFLEERAFQKMNGDEIDEALLFFGCDHPDVDLLYKDELQNWTKENIVKTFFAFSRIGEESIKYVQHKIWNERQEIIRLYKEGARIYVCGDGKRMAPAVRNTLIKIYQEETNVKLEEAELWANQIEKEGVRYATDVFS